MKIKDKVAWVTGGISGIGAATAEALYREGAKLLLTDINDELGLEYVKQFGDDAIYVHADNADYLELEAAAAKAAEKWGHLDLLFNSAGSSYVTHLLFADDEDKQAAIKEWEYGMKVIVDGSFHTARIALNYFLKNEPDENGERGSIIFIASMAADKVYSFFTPPMIDMMAQNLTYSYPYGTGKSAILGLMRDLAVICAPHGVRVNTIKPGYIVTPLTGRQEDGIHGNEVSEMLYPSMQLFPKRGGQPENIATMAIEIFKNNFVNRAAIPVDAGIVG